ncbi:hypothetical protein [Clostridium ljungdahlii]|uniref:Uncharacterized protein n=1 Tax=Clostridium ljungdahlii TaxID=1538 RepID=A0A168PIF7_9CLOT|nr:hypothetical protein [Clostridium ljungdahlii]OAA87787.1 hypothetical protein WY13_01902 [Clostridium ljungdahlii]
MASIRGKYKGKVATNEIRKETRTITKINLKSEVEKENERILKLMWELYGIHFD